MKNIEINKKMNYDTIIIGSGLGGLTAGAKLAKSGQKVFVIEQHSVPGGCATTFKRKHFTMETSLHEMDGLDKEDIKTKTFQELDIFNNIDFVKVPEFYRLFNERIDFVMPDNHEKAIKNLVKKFPQEEVGINKFFQVILEIHKEISKLPQEKWKIFFLFPIFPLIYPNIVKYQKENLGDFLDSIIKDDDLKLILTANIGYYHDDPYTMSMLVYSPGQASFFKGGGHYIKGGSQKLSDYLVKIIKENGGEVVLNHLATKIITNKNKAIGVEYINKLKKDKEIKKIFAKNIIANTAILNVIDLLDAEAREKLKLKTKNLKVACSLFSIYFGFKKPIKEIGNKHYSTFVADKNIKNQADLIKNYYGDYQKRGFVFVDYSQIDSGLAPVGKSVGSITTIDDLKNWDNLSEREYKAKKEKVAQIFIEKLEKLIPGIKEQIEFYEVGTPKTMKRYLLTPQGTPYGFAQIPTQAGFKRIEQKSPIKNFYFASAWTRPGGGFTGAILSGYACAKEILK